MLVSVQSCGDNNKDVKPQALEEIRPRRVKIKACHHRQRAVVCKSLFIQFCVSKYKRLNEEETYIANYVFDDSKNPRSVPNHKFIKHCSYNAMIKKTKFSRLVFHVINSEMLCVYGGYGVTREQLQCLVGEGFIDIQVRFTIKKKPIFHPSF